MTHIKKFRNVISMNYDHVKSNETTQNQYNNIHLDLELILKKYGFLENLIKSTILPTKKTIFTLGRYKNENDDTVSFECDKKTNDNNFNFKFRIIYFGTSMNENNFLDEIHKSMIQNKIDEKYILSKTHKSPKLEFLNKVKNYLKK